MRNGGQKSGVLRQDPPKRRPAHEFRYGRLKATIWRQESDKGPWFNTVATKSYKDDEGNWQTTNGLARDELLLMAQLLIKANDWIWQEQANQQRERQPGEDDEPAPY